MEVFTDWNEREMARFNVDHHRVLPNCANSFRESSESFWPAISFETFTDHTIRGTDSTYYNHPLYNGVSCDRSNQHDVAHSWKSTRLLQPPHIRIMIHVSSESAHRYDRVKRKGAAFLTNLFKSRKLAVGMKINEDEEMERAPRVETPATITNAYRRNGSENDSAMSRIPSTLSVTAVDVVVSCQPSPSHSILTLTPGRTRNIDQDMEALRLSRQDNPFLQVLASRESLVESIEESESDDAILMSQEYGDADPLTLAQVHEHLVRSPPPASWPNSTAFQFPNQDDNTTPGKNDTALLVKSPSKTPSHRGNDHELSRSETSTDIRDRHSHPFSLLHPTPIRSLSEVRRLHRSADDSVQLMSNE